MLNVITKTSDKLVLHGFKAISKNAVIKYGSGILIIDSRPYKPTLKDQVEVKIENDRTIKDEKALVVAKYLLEHKNSLFIEVEHSYYIHDISYTMPDDWKPDM